DTSIQALVRDLLPHETHTRRSRCLGHIINLAAKAFLLGSNCEAFEEEEDIAEQRVRQDEEDLAARQDRWRGRGPVGKFHNIVAFIRASPQRRNAFANTVRGVIATAQAIGEEVHHSAHLTVILENSTRWNSSFYSIQRGLRLKTAIQVFIQENLSAL